MKRIASVAFVAFCLTVLSAPAQLKFAVVNMQKVAKEYNETKEIEELLKQDNEAFTNELKRRQNDLKKLGEEIQKLMQDRTKQGLSDEVREQITSEAKLKNAQFERARQEGQAFERQRRGGLNDKRQRLLRNISEDIKLVVDRLGKREDLNFIFNSGGLGAPLYQKGVRDVTDIVIKDLNKTQ